MEKTVKSSDLLKQTNTSKNINIVDLEIKQDAEKQKSQALEQDTLELYRENPDLKYFQITPSSQSKEGNVLEEELWNLKYHLKILCEAETHKNKNLLTYFNLAHMNYDASFVCKSINRTGYINGNAEYLPFFKKWWNWYFILA